MARYRTHTAGVEEAYGFILLQCTICVSLSGAYLACYTLLPRSLDRGTEEVTEDGREESA